ncbi:D-2-hydroxyacid dehydrogenase [Paenibacillus filicis]|uniref:D-2-hydroxyacid dehydrogenase n=1 Tax=Paenibacillus gyeongsangnamensis TaxID=3388067 RepID=A0ABT4QH39_9BACL|nr:D-2-hydroxyacid dehydrogenase [Paenibacillus filicis]MCZ8516051.1 D-2-hydroxyacid dehydrogenase [Paenibacillus filicis]
MPKIVYLRPMSPKQLERISTVIPAGWEMIHGEKEQWSVHLEDAEILVGWNETAAEQCLHPNTKLKWVQNWGAGVDQMPLAKMAALRIILTNASGVHAFPISETILAMMLAFSRKLHLSIRHQVQSIWKSTGELHEIHGQTMGVIGVGAIGEETARLGKAFGMEVLGVRRSGEPSPYVDRMFDHSGLDEVLRLSDFVIATLPLTPETRHLFGRREFALMKPSAHFINIGRGGTANTEALLEALREGQISGAGLDVFEQEPLPETSPLWQLDNVIITPHNSGSTVYYDDRAMEIFLTNLKAYLHNGRPSCNLVDFEKHY